MQAQQIQKILEQQEQIMAKYQELKNLYENNQLDLEQKELVHQQMQKLNDLYSQNKETLSKLGVWAEKKEEKKKKKKVSFKLVLGLIWAGITLIIWWVALFLYFLLQDLDKVVKFWLTVDQAMLFLQLFTATFLWIFVVVALVILSINLFKIIKKKYKKKIFTILWLVWWSVLLLLTLVFWFFAINNIRNIDLDQSTQLLYANLILQDWSVELWLKPDLYIIARLILRLILI